VFKDDILVQDLRRQWPQSILHNHLKGSRVGFIRGKEKHIQGETLIDGRFAFVVLKYPINEDSNYNYQLVTVDPIHVDIFRCLVVEFAVFHYFVTLNTYSEI